jgi:hypothetical protein
MGAGGREQGGGEKPRAKFQGAENKIQIRGGWIENSNLTLTSWDPEAPIFNFKFQI